MEDWQVIEPENYEQGSPEDAIDSLSVHRYNCQVSRVWSADALLRFQRNYLLRRINRLTEFVAEETNFGADDKERRLADFSQETVDDQLVEYQRSIEHHMWLLDQVRQRLKGHASTMFSGSLLWTTGWLGNQEPESQAEIAQPVMYSRMPIFVEIVWKTNLATQLETGIDEDATLALGVTCNGDVLCLTKSLLRLMEKILLRQNPPLGDEFDKSILLRLSLQRALRGSSWRAISVALGRDHAIVALGNGRVFSWAIGTGEAASGIRPVSVAGLQAYQIVKVVANGFGECFALSRSRKILHWKEDDQLSGESNKRLPKARYCKLEDEHEVLLADDIWTLGEQKLVIALLSTSSRLAVSEPESPLKFHAVETTPAVDSVDTLDGKLVHCAVCPLRGSILLSDADGKLWRTTSPLRPGQLALTVEPVPVPPPWLPGGMMDEWPGWDEIAICRGMIFGITHLGSAWIYSDYKWRIVNLQGTNCSANRFVDSMTPLPSICLDPGNVFLLVQQLSYPDLSTPMEMIATRAESWNVPLYFARRIEFGADQLQWNVDSSDVSFKQTIRVLKPMGTTFEAFFKQADTYFSFDNCARLPSDLDSTEPGSPPTRSRSKSSKIDWKMWTGGVKNWLNSLEEDTGEDRRQQREAQARKFLLHAQQVWVAMRLPVVSRSVVWDLLQRLYTFLPGCLYVQKKHGDGSDSRQTQPLTINTDKVTDAFISKACSTLHYIVSRQNLRADRNQDLELMREASTTELPETFSSGESSSEEHNTVDLRHMQASAEQLLDECSHSIADDVSISYEGFSIPQNLAVTSMGHILQDLPRTFGYCSLFNRMDAPLHRRLMQLLASFVVWDQETGYVQGLSYPAALISLVGESRESCLSLLATFTRQPLFLRILRVDVNVWRHLCQHFEWLLSEKLPNLSLHFQDIGCTCEAYLMGWLQTLFLRCVPVPLGLRLLDGFFIFGSPFLLQTAIALLYLLEPFLVEEDMDTVLQILTTNAPVSGDSHLTQVMSQLENIGPLSDSKSRAVVDAWSSVTEDALLPAIYEVQLPRHSLDILASLERGEEPPSEPIASPRKASSTAPGDKDQVLQIFMREMF